MRKTVFALYLSSVETTSNKEFLKVCPNRIILIKKIEQNLVMSRERYTNMIEYICYVNDFNIGKYEDFIRAVARLSLSIQYN